MFFRKKLQFLAILVLVSSSGLLLSFACKQQIRSKPQTIQLHQKHFQPFFELLASFDKSPASIWAQKTNKMFNSCDVLRAEITADISPLQLFKNLRCHPEKGDIKSTAHFNYKSYQWEVQITMDHERTLNGHVKLYPTSTSSNKSLLLPAENPANFNFLATENTLFAVHANSADSRGLYGLLLDNNQVQNLFGLGTIVGNLLSDRRWAAALYPPTQTSNAPMLVLAAGLSSDAVKNNLVTQFEKALVQQYQLKSRPIQYSSFSGKCFSNIPLFPALAPCVAISAQSALITWNEEALRMAIKKQESIGKSQAGMIGHWDWNAIEKANAILSGDKHNDARPGVIEFEGNQTRKGFQYNFKWSVGTQQ